jgi:hypothetical protein
MHQVGHFSHQGGHFSHQGGHFSRHGGHFSRQRGASLLEGIAYLGIAALVVLGAVSLLTTGLASAKANQSTEELTALRIAVKKLYSGQMYPTGSLLSTVIAAKAVPSTLVVNGGAISNSWGGGVTIDGLAGGTTFAVVYEKVPQDVCMNAVSGATGWSRIAQGTASTATFPVTPTAASTVCSGASNDVTFTAS